MQKSITPIGRPVGVDVHKRRCKVVELDQGEIRKPMANTREDWLEMLTELPPEAEIGLEVSTAGYFAMSVLEEAGWRGSTVIAGRRTTAWTPSGWRPSWPHTIWTACPRPGFRRPRFGSCACAHASAAGWPCCAPGPRIMYKVCWRCMACRRRAAIRSERRGKSGCGNKSCRYRSQVRTLKRGVLLRLCKWPRKAVRAQHRQQVATPFSIHFGSRTACNLTPSFFMLFPSSKAYGCDVQQETVSSDSRHRLHQK